MFTGPNINRNGLVLYLDAANTKSYPGSGTTWANLLPYNNGSFSSVAGGSSPAFLANDNISIQFSGSNDGNQAVSTGSYASVTQYNQINISGSDPFTIISSFYFRNYPPQRSYSDASNYTSLCVKNSYNPSYGLNIFYDLPSPSTSGSFTRARAYGAIRNLTGTSGVTIGYGFIEIITSTSQPLLPNNWYQIAFTQQWNPSLTRHELAIYINGVLSNSTTYTPPSVGGISYPVNFYNTGPVNISNPNISAGNGIYSNLNISQNIIYNRALSATEIQQNYNATKTRFGL